MKVIRSVKVWTEGFKTVDQSMEDLLVLYDFFEMGEATEADIDQHLFSSMGHPKFIFGEHDYVIQFLLFLVHF